MIYGVSSFFLGNYQASENDLDLEELIRTALINNTMLEAAGRRALAAEQAVSQAGALPDPRLTLGMMNLPVNSFVLDREPMTGKQI